MSNNSRGAGYSHSCFFFSSRRRHTRLQGDWSSDVCSSDLETTVEINEALGFEPDSLSLAFSRDWLATAIEAQGRHADAVAEFEKLRPALANEDRKSVV